MQIISYSEAQTLQFGRKIAGKLKAGDIVCLFGELGSGKTVLTRGIAEGLGIKKERIISPSFVLLGVYKGKSLVLNHFDLYRLSGPRDVLNLGYEDYFYDEAVTVIEWADRLKCLLPEKFLKIELKILSDNKRQIKLTSHNQ